MNYDKIIDTIFFIDGKYNKSAAVRYNTRKKKRYSNIKEYIRNRYDDSKSDRETIYRIHYHIEKTPLCPICGNKLKFNGRKGIPFLAHCSNKCKKLDKTVNDKWRKSCGELGTNRNKAKKTMIERYGVENPYQIPEVIEKIKQINKDKVQESLIKQRNTCLQKYGTEYYLQTKEFKEKSRQTCLKKYGVDHQMKAPEVKMKYNTEEIVKKIILTKEKNHTFNTSKDEDESYELLKRKFPDIIRQYKSELYPYCCDFYIPSLDLYIECQYGWQHKNHPFDKDNEKDIETINNMQNKHTKYYDAVIYNWTIRDVKKRETAKQNNLNYIEFWNIEELKEWIKK